VPACDVHHRLDGRAGAPVLLLSNSLGSTLDMWAPQVEALAQRFRVLRYDHRGHGRSPVPPGPWRLADLGHDVLALLDRLSIERASFCGLSLGGAVGVWLAAHAPARVDRLALLCTAARFAPASAWAERARAVRDHGTGAVADAVVTRWFTPGFAAREPRLVARMRAMIASTPARGYAACCEVLEHLDLRDDLAAVGAPTLVVAGGEDPATPPARVRHLAERIAGARLVVVPGAAHLANVEQAATVTALLLDHLGHERR
jgi:3-oxoadipate enol-lactonase